MMSHTVIKADTFLLLRGRMSISMCLVTLKRKWWPNTVVTDSLSEWWVRNWKGFYIFSKKDVYILQEEMECLRDFTVLFAHKTEETWQLQTHSMKIWLIDSQIQSLINPILYMNFLLNLETHTHKKKKACFNKRNRLRQGT